MLFLSNYVIAGHQRSHTEPNWGDQVHQNGAWFAWSNMDSPVQVEVPKWAGYFSESLIARYKP